MAWLGSIASTVLRNVFFESPPNQVLQISVSEYHKRHVHCREDGLILYTPGHQKTDHYEIILHMPRTHTLDQGFSLFRCDDIVEAESRFITYSSTIPVLVEIGIEVLNISKLQIICDTLVEHPTWNVAHVAAHLLLYDVFTHRTVKNYINNLDQVTGESPIQVAIQTNNLKIVQTLIVANCSLENVDFENNTVYHYAANSTKEIILALPQNNANLVNKINNDGYSPLHIACFQDKLECVKALLNVGADASYSAPEGSVPPRLRNTREMPFFHSNSSNEEMQFGGTPLHFCSSMEVMNEILKLNFDVNAQNLKGQTVLHIMVMRKTFSCVATLLGHMADSNIVDNEGNSPLHLAVKQSSPDIVQLLIAFGADINRRNKNSESPRHLAAGESNDTHRILYFLHAVGADRCHLYMTNCHLGCKHDEKFDGIAPPEPPTAVPRTALDQMLYVAGMEKMASVPGRAARGGRLLCLDGGGIRGLVLVQTLLEIEAVLQKPITSCFDWVAGTSTGGILALGLLAGKSLRECQALYFRIKNDAFVGCRPYPSEPLENALKDCLGEKTTMLDIRQPKVMITGVLADRRPVDFHLFRNYDSPSKILRVPCNESLKQTLPPEEQLMWKVARATGAAPSYFRTFGCFLDGGLIANNPTLDAMTEIHEYNLALQAVNRCAEVVPLSVVVSLGTGLIPVSKQSCDVFWPNGLMETAKFALRIQSLFNLVIDQATSTDGRVVDRARTWCSMIGVPYFRFNPQLAEEVPMNEKNDMLLVEMMWSAKAFMYANRDQIKELAAVLDSLSK